MAYPRPVAHIARPVQGFFAPISAGGMPHVGAIPGSNVSWNTIHPIPVIGGGNVPIQGPVTFVPPQRLGGNPVMYNPPVAVGNTQINVMPTTPIPTPIAAPQGFMPPSMIPTGSTHRPIPRPVGPAPVVGPHNIIGVRPQIAHGKANWPGVWNT